MADNIELLKDRQGNLRNLSLSYATRDGIISHCGEIDENSITPRNEEINLKDYKFPNEYSPYTWEGCIVKVADKISYIGRDIEDAIDMGFIDNDMSKLEKELGAELSNSSIINTLIEDICKNSTPEKGLTFSEKALNLMNNVKKYNYENIYSSPKMEPSKRYFKLSLNEIFNTLKDLYDGENTLNKIKQEEKYYPKLMKKFGEWLNNYIEKSERNGLKNKVIYNLNNDKDYYKAIITFISGMTDKFAIDTYNEIIKF